MKTSTIMLVLIGIILILMQLAVYRASQFQFPPLYKCEDFTRCLLKNVSKIIGWNFLGIIGLILILIGRSRKSKTK